MAFADRGILDGVEDIGSDAEPTGIAQGLTTASTEDAFLRDNTGATGVDGEILNEIQ